MWCGCGAKRREELSQSVLSCSEHRRVRIIVDSIQSCSEHCLWWDLDSLLWSEHDSNMQPRELPTMIINCCYSSLMMDMPFGQLSCSGIRIRVSIPVHSRALILQIHLDSGCSKVNQILIWFYASVFNLQSWQNQIWNPEISAHRIMSFSAFVHTNPTTRET